MNRADLPQRAQDLMEEFQAVVAEFIAENRELAKIAEELEREGVHLLNTILEVDVRAEGWALMRAIEEKKKQKAESRGARNFLKQLRQSSVPVSHELTAEDEHFLKALNKPFQQ